MNLEQKISNLLDTDYIGRSLFCFEKLGSTNDFLKNAAGHLPDGCTCVARNQVAGKGRRGKKWSITNGDAATFSFLLNEKTPPAVPVTLICGLAAARALNSLGGSGFLIKWPNDIVFSGKKVCGILCESKVSSKGCATVCGIGVNLMQSPKFFKNNDIPFGGSVKMLTGKNLSIEQTVAAILNEFEKLYKSACAPGAGEKFIEAYSAMCVTIGKEIEVTSENGKIRGTATAVNTDGTLCVDCGGKTVNLLSGTVSVRGVMGYI